MGYVLEGGPQDGEYVDTVPEGYTPKGIDGGAATETHPSPVTRAVWVGEIRRSGSLE